VRTSGSQIGIGVVKELGICILVGFYPDWFLSILLITYHTQQPLSTVFYTFSKKITIAKYKHTKQRNQNPAPKTIRFVEKLLKSSNKK